MPFPFYPKAVVDSNLSVGRACFRTEIVGYLHDVRLSEYGAFPLKYCTSSRRHNSNALLLTLWTLQLDKIIGFCRVYVAHVTGTVTVR